MKCRIDGTRIAGADLCPPLQDHVEAEDNRAEKHDSQPDGLRRVVAHPVGDQRRCATRDEQHGEDRLEPGKPRLRHSA